MKLLHVNASYKPAYVYGGPTMSVSKLCEEMAKAGCEVEVFTTTANGTEELEVEPGKPVMIEGVKVTYFTRITKDHTHYSPDLLRAMRLRVKAFDAVHIHAWWNLVSLMACRTAQQQGVPVIISPRGTLSLYSFSNKNGLVKNLLHKLMGRGLLERSFIHVTSSREQAAMETLVKSKAIFNIPNFIALPKPILPGIGSKQDVLKLLFFSRIEKKKGLEILLNALISIDISYTLTIAGDGDAEYLASLRSLAEKNGLSRHISWSGFVGDEKFDVMRAHDLLVLPSYDENFGNVIIESLHTGTAVLMSNNVGLAPYVEANDLGWVVENHPSDFRNTIRMIARDRTKLAAIRANAPGIISADFDEKFLRQKYLNMYHQITGHGAI